MEEYLDGFLTKYQLQSYYDLGYRWEDKNIIYKIITPWTVVSTKTVINFGIFSMFDYWFKNDFIVQITPPWLLNLEVSNWNFKLSYSFLVNWK